jgi:hypothetical protein
MRRFALALILLPALLAPPSALAQVCDPSFGGKYQDLVRQIAVPEDAQQYGACHDFGPWNGTSYKGHDGLPQNAFWTYSAPHWYIWAKRGQARMEIRGAPPAVPPAPGLPAPSGPVQGGSSPSN